MNDKKKILDFMKTQKLMVLSTIHPNGGPEAAVMEFAEDKLELIFDTFTSYRKYRNLKANPSVAAVIGWDNGITVQYEGLARELSGKEKEQAIQLRIAKMPHAKKFASMKEVVYFKISPVWIRYADYSKEPWNVFEVEFPQK